MLQRGGVELEEVGSINQNEATVSTYHAQLCYQLTIYSCSVADKRRKALVKIRPHHPERTWGPKDKR
jgi:hypothetical protein